MLRFFSPLPLTNISLTGVRLQAVMELGATVCTVHQPPSCASCPLRGVCHAYADVLENPGGAPPVTSYPAKVRPYEN